MQRKSGTRAFTLVELLVVIGIIAVLIAMLLPALGKVRDQAQTVQCSSNMRELHAAFVLYSQMYNGFTLPAQAANSTIGAGASDYWWLGTETLGRTLGVKGSQQDVLDRLAKMLNCPATERDRNPASGLKFSFDYTYNSNFGDIRGQNPQDPNYAAYNPAHAFKKWTQIPGNALALVDVAEPIVANDERFDILSELTWKKGYGGSPHKNRKKGNALFHDGSVHTINVFTKDTRHGKITIGTAPSSIPQKEYTDLEEWMIAHPGHLVSGSLNSGGFTPDKVWDAKRALPF